MRARDIVGKRVKKVVQFRTRSEPCREGYWVIQHIEFEDGTRLEFMTIETEAEYFVAGIVRSAPQPRGAQLATEEKALDTP